ncbi:MAG: hypothetical protein CL566_01200 [Alphaproteobacteria bacterium]|nr:hypothetical protein [Alphaproteobacteria bacterium]
MADDRHSPSTPETDDAHDTEPAGMIDPGRIPLEERWAPISGHRPAPELPAAFRTRWLAAVVGLAVIIGVLALLG